MRGLTLLALVVGSAAIEVDLNYLTSLSDDVQNYVSSNLRSLLKEHARPEHALPELKNKTTCKACMQEGTKYVIEQTVGKMKGMCKAISNNNTDPKNCIGMKICGMMAKHPKVMLGMMIEHVRPMSLATAYCVGDGSCEKPDSITMSEIAMGSEPHEALLDNFDKIDWSDVEADTEALQTDEEDKEMGEGDAPKCEAPKRHMPVCPWCMKKAMRHAVGFAVMKVKSMCANVDKIPCPVMKKMCPWMAQNKEVSLGMIIGKMEPWKFAFGFCLAKKMSHHGRRGHHGGSGHHHGHHGDWHHHGHHGDGHHGDWHGHGGGSGGWHPHHGHGGGSGGHHGSEDVIV